MFNTSNLTTTSDDNIFLNYELGLNSKNGFFGFFGYLTGGKVRLSWPSIFIPGTEYGVFWYFNKVKPGKVSYFIMKSSAGNSR